MTIPDNPVQAPVAPVTPETAAAPDTPVAPAALAARISRRVPVEVLAGRRIGVDAVYGGEVFHVRHNDGAHFLALLAGLFASEDNRLDDGRRQHEAFFEFLGIDVLAGGRYDDVFGPAGNP